MNLSKRERRCLDRIKARKSIPDTGALDLLERKGAVVIRNNVDDDGGFAIDITPACMAALLGETA